MNVATKTLGSRLSGQELICYSLFGGQVIRETDYLIQAYGFGIFICCTSYTVNVWTPLEEDDAIAGTNPLQFGGVCN